MQYLIDQINDDVNRLIIKWKPTTNTIHRPSIRRHCLDDRGKWMAMPGAVLGFEARKSCVLLINVLRNDLISVRDRVVGTSTAEWSYFRITQLLELETCRIGNRELSPEDFDSHVFPENWPPINQPPNCDEDLRDFLERPNQPRWLLLILNRQLYAWRRYRPKKFYDLAPRRAGAADIAKSVTIHPYAALRFYQTKLSGQQIDRAIRLSIEGGVIFAFDRLSAAQFRRALRECPGTLLIYHSYALSDEQLEHCARFDPFAAIRMRTEVSAPRHAILLARSYTLAFPISEGSKLSRFQEEIIESLIAHPDPWLRAHQKNFRVIIEHFATYAQMRIDHGFLLGLLVKMPKEHQPMVARYLAERI